MEVSALTIVSTNRASTLAPNSLSRGIVCLLIGAIRVLDAIKFVSTSPWLCSVRRYTAAVNARTEASQNP